MIINFLYKCTQILIRIILWINGGITVRGKENIPREGGVIVAANHISYLDPPLLGAVLPRRATFMARKGLFEVPVLSWGIRQTAIPVDREKPQPSTMKETVKRLKNGEVIVLFPEGRRSDTGELLEAKRGIGMVASLSNAPIVPALISGTNNALPVNAKWLKRAKITVVFDKPIYYRSTIVRDAHQHHLLHEDIGKKIMTAIKELKDRHEDNSR
jgi:1-acyl-sn-glycerol-3-phosphate acyltransferase